MSSKPQGTGLGLSVSYSIIDAHNGKIELIDGKTAFSGNTGACFRINLPIVEVV